MTRLSDSENGEKAITQPSILYVVPDRDPCSETAVEAVFSRYLPSAGFRVDFLMPAIGPRKWGSGIPWNGACVYLYWLPRSLPLPARLAGSAIAMASAAARLVGLASRRGYDLVVARDEVFLGLVCLAVARVRGCRFAYQYTFDKAAASLLAAERRSAGIIRLAVVLRARLRSSIQARLLARADLVIAMSDYHRARLIERGLACRRVHVLSMGVNPEAGVNAQADGALIRRQLELGGAPTVVYVGTMSRARRLDVLLDAVEQLRRGMPQGVKLVMVGADPGDGGIQFLVAHAVRLGIDSDVLFVGRKPIEKVPAYIAASDVGVSPIPEEDLFMMSSPTKALEYLNVGRPAVVTRIPDQEELVHASGGGVVVRFDAASIAHGLHSLLTNTESARRMGRSGREYVQARRAYAILAARLAERLRRLLKDR